MPKKFKPAPASISVQYDVDKSSFVFLDTPQFTVNGKPIFFPLNGDLANSIVKVLVANDIMNPDIRTCHLELEEFSNSTVDHNTLVRSYGIENFKVRYYGVDDDIEMLDDVV